MRKLWVISLFFLLGLFGCSSQTTQVAATPPQLTSTPSATSTPEVPTATITATATATATQFLFDTSLLKNQTPNQDTAAVNVVPDPWTIIDKDKITIYPVDRFGDYAYEKNGGIWIVGGFGAVHKGADGKKTWYSMKNGLPVNFFRVVAISPKNEVWIGGTDNSLLRFDGVGWVNESVRLPPGSGAEAWCSLQEIVGIDFDQNGAIWVMNSSFDLYTQVNGQWIYMPSAKNITPAPANGPCVEGIRIKSEKDITIKVEPLGCCDSLPTAYHYDGNAWAHTSDFAEVDALSAARHTSPITGVKNQIDYDNYKDQLSIVSKKMFLPNYVSGQMRFYGVSRDRFWMATDQKNVIWILGEGTDFYHNASGTFLPYPHNYKQDGAEPKNSTLLSFGSDAFYFQEGKNPLSWWSVLVQAGTGGFDSPAPIYPSIDSQNRFWFYHPNKGMATVDNGNLNLLGAINPELHYAPMGQVLPLRDGRVLVGSLGVLWALDGKNWQKWLLPDKNELFSYMSEGANGIIYAATDSGVYRIDLQRKNFTVSIFIVEKRNQAAKLFRLEEDGTAYYINNKIVARFDGKSWHSFLFDTVEIEAATIDKDKAIWIYTNGNGMLRLAPDIFVP